MKLTTRDKVLLFIVLVALIIGCGYTWVIKPKMDGLDNAKTNLESAETELQELKNRLKVEENLDDEINSAYKEAEKAAELFFQYMEPQKLDEYIKGVLDTNKVLIDGLIISDYTISSVDYYSYSPIQLTYPIYEAADVNGEREVPVANVVPKGEVLGAYTIDFSWSADREDICSFMDSILVAENTSLRINSIDFQEPDKEDENGNPYTGVVAEGENPDSNVMPIREYAGSCSMTIYFMEPISVPEIDFADVDTANS